MLISCDRPTREKRRLISVPALSPVLRGEVFLPQKKSVGCWSPGLGLKVMAGFLPGLGFSLDVEFEGATALELK